MLILILIPHLSCALVHDFSKAAQKPRVYWILNRALVICFTFSRTFFRLAIVLCGSPIGWTNLVISFPPCLNHLHASQLLSWRRLCPGLDLGFWNSRPISFPSSLSDRAVIVWLFPTQASKGKGSNFAEQEESGREKIRNLLWFQSHRVYRKIVLMHRHFITLLLGPEEEKGKEDKEKGRREKGTTNALAKTEVTLDL